MDIKENILVEIYKKDKNPETFNVGEVEFQNKDFVLFSLLNPQGQYDGFSFYKKNIISTIEYKTDYLKKIKLYKKYWNQSKPAHLFKDAQKFDSFFHVLKKLYSDNKLITIVTNGNTENILTGYIDKIEEKSIIFNNLDISSATSDGQIEILINSIDIVTYDEIDNILLDFVFNHMKIHPSQD